MEPFRALRLSPPRPPLNGMRGRLNSNGGLHRLMGAVGLLALLWTGPASAELSVALSQRGLDALSAFGLKRGLSLIQAMPKHSSVLLTQEDPGMGAVAQADVHSQVQVGGLRFNLEEGALRVLLEDFSLRSEAALSALFWPVPTWPILGHVGEERLHLNLSLPSLSLGISAQPLGLSSPNARLELASCDVERPEISGRAENYWLVGAGLELGAIWARRSLPALICDQVRSSVGDLLSQTSATIAISPLFAKARDKPGPLGSIARHDIHLRYRLRSLKIKEEYLGATLQLEWMGQRSHTVNYIREFENVTELELPSSDALRDPRTIASRAEVLTEQILKLSLRSGNQINFLLHPSFLNEFLQMVDVETLIIENDVPVTSTEIPERSRRFFSVMCRDCYFKLKALAWGPPAFAVNDSALNVDAFLKSTLWIFNPGTQESSPFIEFVAQFALGIRPWMEGDVLRSAVSLNSILVDIDDSAFPADWDSFVQDLVAGMIHGMMWPGIRELIHSVVLEKGIRIPPACGAVPPSLRLFFSQGRLGASFNLSLETLDMPECQRLLAANFAHVKLDKIPTGG